MSEARGITVLGICGSLRKASFNRATLNTAIELKPASMTIEVAEIGDMPLYNEDVRAQGFPPPVERLRRQIAAADALLFVTPEYNYSMSGVLKNAIDWASRPKGEAPLLNKTVAVIGASMGQFGALWAQQDLRRILGIAGARVVEGELPVPRAHEGLDDSVLDALHAKLEALVLAADALETAA